MKVFDTEIKATPLGIDIIIFIIFYFLKTNYVM